MGVVVALGATGVVLFVPGPQPLVDVTVSERPGGAVLPAIRAVLQDPANRLAGAVIDLDHQVTQVRLGEPTDAAERLDAAQNIRETTLRRVRQAINDAERVTLPVAPPEPESGAPAPAVTSPGSTPDAAPTSADHTAGEAVRSSWNRIIDAAERVAAAAESDLAHTETLADADGTLAGIVDLWSQPGDYSDQLARLDDAAERAAALAEHLETVEDRPPCSDAVGRRVDAAEHVAEASERLRELVRDRQGGAFDELVEELTADPYGLPRSPTELDARESDCFQNEGATPQATATFREAVTNLEDALN